MANEVIKNKDLRIEVKLNDMLKLSVSEQIESVKTIGKLIDTIYNLSNQRQ